MDNMRTGMGIGICPKNLQDLMSNFTQDIVESLDKGMPVMIDPEKWETRTAETTDQQNSTPEADDCECPICQARRAAYKHFEGKYTPEQIDEYLDPSAEAEMPTDLEEFIDERVISYEDEQIGDMLLEVIDPKAAIDVSEVTDDLSVSRFNIEKIKIELHTTRKLDAGKFVIMKAPFLIKMIKPDAPDYLLLGNFSKSDEDRLTANCKSYRWATAFIKKYGDKALGNDPGVNGFGDFLQSILG